MKRRLCAILLASGLAVSLFAAGVHAEETDLAEEQVTEAVEEEPGSAGDQEQRAEYMKQSAEKLLQQLSDMSEEELQEIVEKGDTSSARMASNWLSVRQDLGTLVEVQEQQVETEGDILRTVCEAKYDGVDDRTTVMVTYEMDQAAQTFSVDWDIKYPMSKLMQQAALNTVMGLGIVFLTLLFLSWVIGQLHLIPELVEKINSKGGIKAFLAGRKEPKAPVSAPSGEPAAAPAAAAAAPVKKKKAPKKQETLMDDFELVAVIAAAIAASENTSTDSFVVRSIKKANKSNWQKRA